MVHLFILRTKEQLKYTSIDSLQRWLTYYPLTTAVLINVISAMMINTAANNMPYYHTTGRNCIM